MKNTPKKNPHKRSESKKDLQAEADAANSILDLKAIVKKLIDRL